MYDNIGAKIKVLARVAGMVLLILCVMSWLYYILNTTVVYDGWHNKETVSLKEDDWIGWMSLIFGILGYLSSWFLYGFGQLVEDTEVTREAAVAIYKENHDAALLANKVTAKTEKKKARFCSACGTERNENDTFCESCGNQF